MLGMHVHMIIYVSELVKLVTVAGSCVHFSVYKLPIYKPLPK